MRPMMTKPDHVEIEMLTRNEFEAFRMKWELWQMEAERRITALEIKDRERDRQYVEIKECLVRLDTRQELMIKSMQDHQERMASAFDTLTDKLVEHVTNVSKPKETKGA